jgi:hypothetical protein
MIFQNSFDIKKKKDLMMRDARDGFILFSFKNHTTHIYIIL